MATSKNEVEHEDNECLLSIKDVAEMVAMAEKWVYRQLGPKAKDRIPAFRLGKCWRFRKADVIAWLERHRN